MDGAGAIVVSGIGLYAGAGTVVKTFAIDDGTKQAAEDLAAAKDKALKEAVADAGAKDTALKQALAKLDTANKTIFSSTVPAKSKFKLTAGAKKATVKWGKIGTSTVYTKWSATKSVKAK